MSVWRKAGRTMKHQQRGKSLRRPSLLWILGVFLLLGPVFSVRAAEPESASPEAFYLLRLINEARTAPAAMLERAGLDVAAAQEALGEDAWILDRGLPPLATNESLMASAAAHLSDMVERLYYGEATPEGLGPQDRAQAAGYPLGFVAESLGLLGVVTFVDGADAVWIVFRQWLVADLAAPPEARRIFALWPWDGGAAFRPVSVLLDGAVFNAYVAVVDYGFPLVFQPMVLGAVRAPSSAGPFLNPGIPGPAVTVRCRSEDGALWWEMPTHPLGGYQCPAVPGRWMIVEVLHPEDGSVWTAVSVQGAESHLALDLFP